MPENFTDEELAFLRHARFGELPARVLPADLVELKETEPAHDYADLAYDARDRHEGY
ncbi:hypothetical protein [Actinokineospora sp. NBRC 105648]|uniref:hypothetical protein n=1 Tax=Actinokineospora sp. NBRC 105648 TaxID=3032206 RepID=UPI0024A338C2|nr:hypothetical protein [Actinokineospora sp. NBRC 105648]GLZ39531.1 hypothetical protein Acsp05_31550 [Actinokineospora sp. NBRC 105648]